MKTETTNLPSDIPSLKLVLSKYHTILLEKDKDLQDRDIRIKNYFKTTSIFKNKFLILNR